MKRYVLRKKGTDEYLTVYGWSWEFLNRACALEFPNTHFNKPPRALTKQCVREYL